MFYYIYFILLIAFIIAYYIVNDKSLKNYPPGPPRYPVIGSWLSIPAREIEKIIPIWRNKYGNLIGHKLLNKNIIVLTGYKEITSAMRNNNFQNRCSTLHPWLKAFFKTYGLFLADGDQWSEMRRFTMRYLGQISAAKFELVIHDEMMDFFSVIESGEIVEVNNKFLNFATYSICAILLGDVKKKYANEIDTIREDSNKAFKAGRATGLENYFFYLRAFFIGTLGRSIMLYGNRFFQRIVDEHRASFDENDPKDYIDAFLLQQKREKELSGTIFYTDKELVACLSDMIRTAGESTGQTAAFLLLYLALNPEVQKKMHEEMDEVLGDKLPKLSDRNSLSYTDAVLYETIRINSIAPISPMHVVIETTQFFGYTIPKDSFLIFALRDLLMNAELFAEPKKFKPERFIEKDLKSKVIAFGLGKRSCIGEVVSKNTLFLFIAYFFQKYSISLPEGYENPSTEAEPGFTTGARSFKVVIHKRR